MKNDKLTIAAFTAVVVILSAFDANAEEDYIYQTQPAHQAQQAANYQPYVMVPGNDQQYMLPKQYHGQYYPEEPQGKVGYHGTVKSSDASTTSESFYYSYY